MARASVRLAAWLVLAVLGRAVPAPGAEGGPDARALLAKLPFFENFDALVKMDQVEVIYPARGARKVRLDIKDNPLFRGHLERATRDTRRFVVDGCRIAGVPYRLNFGTQVTVGIKSAVFEVDGLNPPRGRIRFVFDVRHRKTIATNLSIMGVQLGVSTVVNFREEKSVLFDLNSKKAKVLMLLFPTSRINPVGEEFEVWADVESLAPQGI